MCVCVCIQTPITDKIAMLPLYKTLRTFSTFQNE